MCALHPVRPDFFSQNHYFQDLSYKHDSYDDDNDDDDDDDDDDAW